MKPKEMSTSQVAGKKSCKKPRPIKNIGHIHKGCNVGFKVFGKHIGFDVCKPIVEHVVNPLIDDLNKGIVGPINSVIGDLGFTVCEIGNELQGVTKWWDFVKDDVDLIVGDIKLIKDILNMNIFAYIQAWLQAITGLPLVVVFWIALALVVFLLL